MASSIASGLSQTAMVTTLKVDGPLAFSNTRCQRNPRSVWMKAKLRSIAAWKSARAEAGTEKLSIRNRSRGCFSKSNVNAGMGSSLCRNHNREILSASACGRPDEEHRRGDTEGASEGMEAAPGVQEPQRLIRSTITMRIQQPIVRRANGEQRERHDREDEHRGPHPELPAPLHTANDSEQSGNECERHLHDRRAFVARRPLSHSGLDAARQARRMFNSRNVDRCAREPCACEDRDHFNELWRHD